MITQHYTKTVDVERLTPITGTETEEYASHLSAVDCHIQPLDDAWTQDETGKFGKEWLMFCDNLDIKEHDHVIHGEIIYRVVGIENYDEFRGIPRHMEIRLRKSMP